MPPDEEGTTRALREQNRRRMLRVLLDRVDDGATQAELAQATRLSRPSVSNLLPTFGGVIRGVPTAAGDRASRATGGRRAAVVALDASAGVAASIDIGRRRIAAAVGDVFGRVPDGWSRDVKLDFNVQVEPRRTLARAARLLNGLLDDVGVRKDALIGVAIGLPGPVSDGRPRGDEMGDWTRDPVGDAMFEALRRDAPERWRGLEDDVRILVENDGNLAALAEHRWGAARGVRDVLQIKWSTGLGAGLVIDGALRRGAGGAAGEVAHTPVKHPKTRKVVSLQSVIGWRVLAPDLSEEDIACAARDPGHPGHRRVAKQIAFGARLLGSALTPLVNTLNPQMIVVNGMVDARAEHLFAPSLLEGLDKGRVVPAARRDLCVRGGVYNTDAAVRGGIARVLDEFAEDYLLIRGKS
jgi:predicted NBD/HSP70 family sugar kinase